MPISIRLPHDIEERLESLTARTGRSKTFYIREAILEHIDEIEDYYLSEKVAQRVKEGKERTYTIAELEQELGLED